LGFSTLYFERLHHYSQRDFLFTFHTAVFDVDKTAHLPLNTNTVDPMLQILVLHLAFGRCHLTTLSAFQEMRAAKVITRKGRRAGCQSSLA
jgi:hypothetical protein